MFDRVLFVAYNYANNIYSYDVFHVHVIDFNIVDSECRLL